MHRDYITKDFQFKSLQFKEGMIVEASWFDWKVVFGGTEETPNGTEVNVLGLGDLDQFCETIATPNLDNGCIHMFSSAGGWNTSIDYWVLDDLCHPWPTKAGSYDSFIRLKKGETLKDDFPWNQPRALQQAWLDERECRWFPSRERKPLRYAKETQVLSSDNLQSFSQALGLKPEELSFEEKVLDPGKKYRDMGFTLEMSDEEFNDLGEKHFVCFRAFTVRNALEQPKRIRRIWTSPKVWTKAKRKVGRKGKRTATLKLELSYMYVEEDNLHTNEFSNWVQLGF